MSQKQKDGKNKDENQVDRLKGAVKDVLIMRVGRSRAIPMNTLYRRLCGEWKHSVNDARHIREAVRRLRDDDGMPICTSYSSKDGGYYLAGTESEMRDFIQKFTGAAIRRLAVAGRMVRRWNQEYGQDQLQIEWNADDMAEIDEATQ